MRIKTAPINMPQGVMHFAHMVRLPATRLPGVLSYREAADVICSRPINECDLQINNVGLWILDSKAQLGHTPKVTLGNDQDPAAEEAHVISYQNCSFSVGRSLDKCDLALPYDYVSRDHLAIKISVDFIEIENKSKTNGVFTGGGWIGPSEKIEIEPDAPFLIGINQPLSKTEGFLLISPMNTAFNEEMKTALKKKLFQKLDEFIMGDRKPPQEFFFRKTMIPAPISSGVPHQAADLSETMITPPQILDANKHIKAFGSESIENDFEILEFIKGWIARDKKTKKGRLDRHVKGHKKWDRRLLDNVRLGGMLLATHSTDLAGAVAILKSSQIDPKYSRKGKAYFRYGFGHSYGQVVFIQRTGTSDLGKINDIWDVMRLGQEPRQELLRLVRKVDYNKNIPVKDIKPAPGDPEGRTALAYLFDEHALMELFPQFESLDPVSTRNTFAILAPHHLYNKLISEIKKLRDNKLAFYTPEIIRIPGTGKRESDFLRKRDKVARRTRFDGGTFQPKIGRDALFRYELTYFKIVEAVVRSRHRALRKKIEEFGRAVARSELSHSEIVRQISETTALLPEAFGVLHLRKQYPSHDGHSPLGHTMNAVLEAAYLAPRLAQEFKSLHIEDVFIALWLHDLGKMYDAKSDEHEKLSIELAEYHLKMMDLKGKEGSEEQTRRERILHLIKNAGLISKATMALEKGESMATIADRLLPQAGTLLPEIFLMNFADTASIPGRSGRKMLVNTDYKGVVDVRRKLIEAFRELLEQSSVRMKWPHLWK